MTENGRIPEVAIRTAAELRWSVPVRSWGQVAEAVGISERQLRRWRETEQWEIAFREAGAEQIESLAPAAVAALLRAWAKGNPANAIDVLRSFGFVRNEHVEIKIEAVDEHERETLEKLLERAQA